MAKPLSDLEVTALQAQVADLQARLNAETTKRTEAESTAHALSQAGMFTGNTEEQPTGKTVTISVCLNPHEREEKKQKFKDVEFPTYFYTIMLPPGAGADLTTNGTPYYHGSTYEVDAFTLADLKSRVARTWDHEKSIHGENENSLRKQSNLHLMTPAARARMGAH